MLFLEESRQAVCFLCCVPSNSNSEQDRKITTISLVTRHALCYSHVVICSFTLPYAIQCIFLDIFGYYWINYFIVHANECNITAYILLSPAILLLFRMNALIILFFYY